MNLMQMARFAVNTDSIAWVCCASGNVGQYDNDNAKMTMTMSMTMTMTIIRWPLVVVSIAALLSSLLSGHTLYTTYR